MVKRTDSNRMLAVALLRAGLSPAGVEAFFSGEGYESPERKRRLQENERRKRLRRSQMAT